jgi:hypothetical protein
MRITLNSQELLQTVRRHMEREEKLELDSMWLTTLLDQLRQIALKLDYAKAVGSEAAMAEGQAHLDQLRLRINKDLQQVLEAEQYDDTPSRESTYP